MTSVLKIQRNVELAITSDTFCQGFRNVGTFANTVPHNESVAVVDFGTEGVVEQDVVDNEAT
jgi:hypothetical protein